MKVKDKIKKNRIVKNIIFQKNLYDYEKDKKFFVNNYMYSKKRTINKIEYDMLFEIHKIEKGLAVINNQRPFGSEKIKRLIEDIREYDSLCNKKSFTYNLAHSVIEEYLEFYKTNGWDDKEEYIYAKNFILKRNGMYKKEKAGAYVLKKDYFKTDISIEKYNSFLTKRKSVRNFSSKKLNEEDIKKAVECAILTPTACNRQMCKIYYINSKKNKDIIEKFAQGLGLFELENSNYFLITFDIAANYFSGERNQGWFNSGLVTINFINALHSLGIGSCCIQFGNSFKEEKEFKKLLNIPSSERVAVIITAGYYDEISKIPYSTRKPIEEVFNIL